MESMEWELAISHTADLFMWIAGVVVVAVLLGAFFWGQRVRGRESRPPRPEEQPKRPYEGPVREEREYREPDEVSEDGHRLNPHELKGGYGQSSTHRCASQDPKDHRKGDGGSFGSGGLGS